MFNTYLFTELSQPHCICVRIYIIERRSDCIKSLVSATLTNNMKRAPRVFEKRIHPLTHAPSTQVRDICEQAGVLTRDLDTVIGDMQKACGICAAEGQTAPSKKISLTHVNERFNMEVQIDIAFEVIRNEKRMIFVITDMGTSFTEGSIINRKAAEATSKAIENLWILKHGASSSMWADEEFNRNKFKSLMQTHGIIFKPRPTRRRNKTGAVERKYGQ